MSGNAELANREETKVERSRELPVAAPVVDIYENDKEILLYADMPGVAKEEITVNIDNGKLTITGVRMMEVNGALNRAEFGDVEYRRTFSVPQTISVATVNAELKDGILRLHLPKSEAARPRQIEIKQG
jgi:HSP20 family molecular chaperone IbpA